MAACGVAERDASMAAVAPSGAEGTRGWLGSDVGALDEPHAARCGADAGAAAPRPRVLWKGLLALHDGTLLPGVSIHAQVHPWLAEDASQADTELCLAIEMLRHRPLRVVQVLEDDGSGEAAAARSQVLAADVGPRATSRTSVNAASETVALWRASGAIYMCVRGARQRSLQHARRRRDANVCILREALL